MYVWRIIEQTRNLHPLLTDSQQGVWYTEKKHKRSEYEKE